MTVDRSCLASLAVRTLVYPDCCLITNRVTSPTTTTMPTMIRRIFFMCSACSQLSRNLSLRKCPRDGSHRGRLEFPDYEDARRRLLLGPANPNVPTHCRFLERPAFPPGPRPGSPAHFALPVPARAMTCQSGNEIHALIVLSSSEVREVCASSKYDCMANEVSNHPHNDECWVFTR